MSAASEAREKIAERVASALDRSSSFSYVKADGDRVTFLCDGRAVTLIVADARDLVPPDITACPFCGSKRLHSREADERFEAQRGCLDCDRWIDPVRTKR